MNCLYYIKDKIGLERWTKNQAFIKFNAKNIY